MRPSLEQRRIPGRRVLALGVVLAVSCRRPEPVLDVVVPPGLRVNEVAAVLAQAGLGDASALAARARDPAFCQSLGVPAPTLEGYLGAGRIELPASAGIDTVLAALVGAQRARLDAPTLERARARGLDERQLLTLASLVEAEARAPGELPVLAGILAARAARGWHLDSDASVRFARNLGRDAPVTAADRQLDDPYVTFRHPGLPPGPVQSPGPDALAAVLAHGPGDELVALHDPEGRLRLDLEAAERDALASIPADPRPPKIVRDTHYIVSNEHHAENFRAAVDHLGGVSIGVGAEQNYLLAGWSRPELLVLSDFDQVITNVHAVYEAALREAASGPELVALFDGRAGWRRLEAAFAREHGGSELATLRRTFRGTRKKLGETLRRVAADYAARGVPCFLTDAEQYAHVAALARHGRILALRGDLTGPRTLRRIGEVLAASRRVVRVLYLSNAEQYFAFTPAYRLNLLGLPVDSASLVLRTRPTGPDYTYMAQRFDNLRLWLDDDSVRGVDALAPRRLMTRHRPFLELTSSPPRTRKNVRPVIR